MVIIYALLVLFIAFFTYFRNYWYPQHLFWDENYHIVSAYKYLNQVMFMEPHPPLGKLFIALGEYIFHPNQYIDTADFLTTDYIKDIPAGFSFVGVRFFPVLFATLSAVLFFFILYKISKSSYLSFLFSSFYLFDNALIVHSRGAMLESIQIFFILGSLLYFLVLFDKEKVTLLNYFILGILVGLVVSVKLNGVIFVLLFFPLFFYKARNKVNFLRKAQYFIKVICIFGFGTLLIFCGSYYIHGFIGQQVLENRYYHASSEYKRILNKKQANNLFYLPLIIKDNLLFSQQYEAGVAKSDENGSLPYLWPFGDKSVDYRWEIDNGFVRYLYLQGNPFIWFSGLFGIISSFLLVVRVFFFRRPIRNKRLFSLIAIFLALYIFYMGSLLTLARVMYLYHYFIPLLLSLFLSFIVYVYIFEKHLQRKNKLLFFLTGLFMIIVVLGYWFFSPLTYYQPLSRSDFLMREWLPFWQLKPV